MSDILKDFSEPTLINAMETNTHISAETQDEAAEKQVQFYLGLLKGEPVAAPLLFLHGGVE